MHNRKDELVKLSLARSRRNLGLRCARRNYGEQPQRLHRNEGSPESAGFSHPHQKVAPRCHSRVLGVG